MNIKIDCDLKDKLLKHTSEEDIILFGSEGGNDKDYLCILPPNHQMDGALHNRDHFLFYKDEKNNTDYLFTTPRYLINGLVTGSNTLMYELLKDHRLYGTVLESFQYIELKKYVSYKLAKAFIGIAQRDFKQSSRLSDEEAEKKMKWVRFNIEVVNEMCQLCGISSGFTSLEDLRNKVIINLPKVCDPNVLELLKTLPKTVDIPEISEVEYVYFKNWSESL